MKKPLIMVILFFVFAVVALATFTYQKPSEAYVNLADQFDLYLGRDISTSDKFVSFINAVELEHTSENVKVTVVTQSQSSQQQSGVIVAKEGRMMYVVTSDQYLDQTKRQTYQIHDFKDDHYTGSLIASDQSYHIILLAFDYDFNTDLTVAEQAEYLPFTGEIVATISAKEDIINYLELGKFTGVLEDSNLYKVELNISEHSLGGSVYDINLKLIGIMTKVDDVYCILSAAHVYNFVSSHI